MQEVKRYLAGVVASSPVCSRAMGAADEVAAELAQGPTPACAVVRFENRLLRQLSGALIDSLQPHLTEVTLTPGDQLLARGERLHHFWFLESGVCALSPLRDGAVVSAMIGAEGFVGACSLLGRGDAAMDCRVIFAGSALRIPATVMFALLDRCGETRELLVRYVQTLHVQTASTAFSASALTVAQRVARWIVMASDRIGQTVPATHELIAETLQVRRAGVTDALHALAAEGFIERKRSAVIVLDRQGLCGLAGEAYGLAEQEYMRLIGGVQGNLIGCRPFS